MKTIYYSTDGARGLPLRGLFRWIEGPDTLKLEKWTGEAWVDWPDLLRATGMGGNSEYVRITEEEARPLLANPYPA